MKIKFIKACKDKDTNELYHANQEKEFDDDRALEIIEKGFAVEVLEEHEKIEYEPPQVELVKLSDLKVEDLREICKANGLTIRGTKEEIIERILKYQEEMENGAE